MKDLGKKLYLDSGTLTPILKKLELVSLIQRKRSESDERNVYISLTEEGNALKRKAANVPKELLCSLAFSDTDNTSSIALLSILHQLMNTLTCNKT